jgi:predicted translin family RNA/ssDNA-binding protein
MATACQNSLREIAEFIVVLTALFTAAAVRINFVDSPARMRCAVSTRMTGAAAHVGELRRRGARLPALNLALGRWY